MGWCRAVARSMAWAHFTPLSGDNTAECDFCHRVIKMGPTRWCSALHLHLQVHHRAAEPHEEAPPRGVGPAAGALQPQQHSLAPGRGARQEGAGGEGGAARGG